MLQLQSTFGVFALLALTWACGENRRAVSLRQAAIGLVVTFVTAVVLIKLPIVAHGFGAINDAVGVIAAASRAGTPSCLAISAAARCRSTSRRPVPISSWRSRRCRSCW
jgi:nucleoside permease NupC